MVATWVVLGCRLLQPQVATGRLRRGGWGCNLCTWLQPPLLLGGCNSNLHISTPIRDKGEFKCNQIKMIASVSVNDVLSDSDEEDTNDEDDLHVLCPLHHYPTKHHSLIQNLHYHLKGPFSPV